MAMSSAQEGAAAGSPKCTLKRQRKVKFSERHILTYRKLSDEDKGNVWWTASEFEEVRLAAKLATLNIRKQQMRVIADIDEAYTTALHLSCTLDEPTYISFMEDPSEYSGCLQEWCSPSGGGRGLEKYTSFKHRFERAEFSKQARAAVLRLFANPNLDPTDIASFYRDYSRTACIYARLVGEADAASLRFPNCTDEVREEADNSTPPKPVAPLTPNMTTIWPRNESCKLCSTQVATFCQSSDGYAPSQSWVCPKEMEDPFGKRMTTPARSPLLLRQLSVSERMDSVM